MMFWSLWHHFQVQKLKWLNFYIYMWGKLRHENWKSVKTMLIDFQILVLILFIYAKNCSHFLRLKNDLKEIKTFTCFYLWFLSQKINVFRHRNYSIYKSIQNYNYNKNKCYLKHSLMAYSNTDWVGRLTRKIADSMSWHMDR